MKTACYFFIPVVIMITDVRLIRGDEIMSESTFLSVKKIEEIAMRDSKLVSSGSGLISLPFPFKSMSQLHIVFFFCPSWMGGGKHTVYPPYYIMRINPVSGKVIQFRKCIPEDFGFKHDPETPLLERKFDPKPDPNVKVWKMVDRFESISPVIWGLYDRGKIVSDPKTKELIREYHSLFDKLAGLPVLIPYYKAISPDFFAWLEKHIR